MAQKRIDPKKNNLLTAQSPYESSRGDYGSLDQEQSERKLREQSIASLKAKLKSIKEGKDNSEYENFCKDLIAGTFQEFDANPQPKIREFDYEDGSCGNETDVYMPIRLKPSYARVCNFWEDIMKVPNKENNRGYNARTLVFECKNNNFRIEKNSSSKKEERGGIIDNYIYQLFRYLSPQNRFGVLMCRNMKLTRHALRAISRIRAEGYFVLIIDDTHLLEKEDDKDNNIDGWFETFIKTGSAELFFRNHYDRQERIFREEYTDEVIVEESK